MKITAEVGHVLIFVYISKCFYYFGYLFFMRLVTYLNDV